MKSNNVKEMQWNVTLKKSQFMNALLEQGILHYPGTWKLTEELFFNFLMEAN